jgi:D-amino peptidase
LKFYISADIEGVAGVVSYEQTLPGSGVEWERARIWMTDEVLAAAEAAHSAGATEVIVSDSHASGQNILIERLPSYVRLVRSGPRPLNMVQGVEEPGISACAFIGYHASSHHPGGILAHTYSGLAFRSIRLNGVIASEAYANAAVAGEIGIPLIALSGDDECIAEALQWFPHIETAVVKRAYSRLSAITVTPAHAQSLIRSAIERGLRRMAEFRPFILVTPIVTEIEFVHRLPAELLAWLPCFERSGAYTIKYLARSMSEAMRILQFASSYSPRAGTVNVP